MRFILSLYIFFRKTVRRYWRR